jgi:serine/threonine-protein kinase
VIEQELGRGGMATVYRARDRKHDRRVAVKVLRPQLAASLGAARFLYEIKSAAGLVHPHILPLHDSGEAGGFLYYVMPFVEGESLRDRLTREQQLPLEDALQIARAIADALAYAHSHDLVHRDIKPENILFEAGHAVLSDFGIARAITAAAREHLTETGLAIGTPAYMSPEQASGAERIDGRSDIYALGCVLYEMLAGEPPFTGPTPQAILAKRLTDPVPDLCRVRDTVPVAVSDALRQALARVPADRFATAVQFADALSSDTLAAPAPEKSIAVLPFANLSADPENEYFSDGMTEEIINALSQVPTLRVAARTSSFGFKEKNMTIPRLGRELQVSTVLEGSVRRAGSKLRITAQLINAADGYHLWSERYDREMADVFAIQEEIAQAIVGTLKVKLLGREDAPIVKLGTADLEAYHLYLQGAHFWRNALPLKAIKCFEAAIERDPQYAHAFAGLADSYCLLGSLGHLPSTVALSKARASADRAITIDDRLAEGHKSRGLAELFFGWDFPLMERALTRAIALNPQHANAHAWLGVGLALLGRLDEANAEVRRAQELEPILNNPLVALVHICARDYDRAIDACRRALEINATSVAGLWVIGVAYSLKREYEAAIAALQQAVAHSQRSPDMLMELGAVYAQAGRTGEVKDVLDELRQRAAQSYIPPICFAKIHMHAREIEEAFAWFERALDDRNAQAVWVAVWPGVEHVRADPRFAALLKQRGLGVLLGEAPP